jgi:uncharacterized HhH-GPD family protein
MMTSSLRPSVRDRAITQALLAHGRRLQAAELSTYTDDPAAERFIRRNANAYLFGVIFDQGIDYRRAWAAPYRLRRRLGHLDMKRLAHTPLGTLRRAVRGANPGEALARFVNNMSRWLKGAANLLVRDYQGNAANIWRDCRTAGEVIERLEQVPGIGQKKAHMTARLLYDERVARFARWREINVAVDVHVKRVFRRTGLVRAPIPREILAAAIRLHPRYPGQLDYPAWDIGMTWCHARGADCRGQAHKEQRPCPLLRVCPQEVPGHLPLGP